MNAFTVLAILHVWAATPGHYDAFEIAVSPGYTEKECNSANAEAIAAGRNLVCRSDEEIAAFVNNHACEAIPTLSVSATIRFVCVK